jgi:membrane protein implicated in regulation of membrane protease activity
VDVYVYWIVAGIVLVIVELLTGTFYLLVLGVAAAGGAALAYLGLPFGAQAGVATAIAVIGAFLVNRYRARTGPGTGHSNDIDVGHRVTLDSWVNESEGLARVRYRATLWDAKVSGERRTGSSFYIRAINGSTLHVEAE